MRRVILTYLGIAALVVASVGGAGCSNTCNCPDGAGFAAVPLPAAKSSPIASITADRPCAATDGGNGQVFVRTDTPTSCEVHVRLASGDTYLFFVVFDTANSGCCGLIGHHNAVVPELVDASIDSRDGN